MTTRRGLSSVVGGVFAIIAITTVIAYVTFSMNTLDQYNQSVLTKSQQILDLGKEQFKITNVGIVGNKFNITVSNTGTLPINFTKMWVQNTTTGVNDWVRSYSPRTNPVGAGAILTNIGQVPAVYASSTQTYQLKLVTSRGNTQVVNLGTVGSAPLNIQFYALPSNIASGFTTELVMVVTNNGSNTLTNVTPLQPVAGAGLATVTALSAQSSPPNYATLAPGGTAVFKWDVTLAGAASNTKTFTAQLQGGLNTASTTITIGTLSTLNSAPILITLDATPPNVITGAKSLLVMRVTNNGSGTLSTITPTLSVAAHPATTATCTLDPINPASSLTNLLPGSTATFTWGVKVSGGVTNLSCSYSAALVGGYPGNYANSTVTETEVNFASTTLAQNTGIMTLNYSTFRFTQSGGTYTGQWFTGWNFTASKDTAFSVNMTNNNSTGDFWVSSYTQIYFTRTSASNTGSFFISGSVTPGNPFTQTAYCGGSDWCLRIPSGKTVTVYFASKNSRQGTSNGNIGQTDTYMTNMLLYGKFASSQFGSGTRYAQSLPYIAFLAS